LTEVAIETTYPLPEEISSTLLTNTANFFGVVLIVMLTFIVQTQNKTLIIFGNFLLASLNLLAAFLIPFFQPTYKRLLIETEVLKSLEEI
jgi:FLVCR family feline leukemia virus subgroup C receptor-related protein